MRITMSSNESQRNSRVHVKNILIQTRRSLTHIRKINRKKVDDFWKDIEKQVCSHKLANLEVFELNLDR